MIRIRSRFVGDAERDQVLSWLDIGLRPGRAGRLAREYPLLLEADSEAIPITVWSGGRPVSFCVLWPTRFAITNGVLRAGLVSLVYTDPRERGRGLARLAIERALAEAAAQGLGLCMLWSDLDAFYASQGFSRAGQESLVAIDDTLVARALADGGASSADRSESKVERADPAAWSEIAAIRASRRCHLPLGASGAKLLRIPDLDARVVRGAQGITAFAICGRGDDFAGVIHEWGGDPTDALRCCAALLAECGPGSGLLLLAPIERSELAWRLRQAGAQRVENSLAWFKIASVPALMADLDAIAPAFSRAVRVEQAISSESAAAGVVLLGHTDAERCPLSASELVALLFSRPEDPACAAVRGRLGTIVPESALAELPLPFFVSGLESI